ncbi:soluble lamin-associated protein of 75 kDa isoform X2 [Xenopus laevis]|uniref:Soluble lamin-associated protein of 75 kDa isoform X2 n=1 Tax=Xenopus laevis TaxID=8355 RepID=A0A8J1L872_XENLA|nr:soluble lamin-associated protein of 75 kDa isoform X2 [Xenopus laevis]
MAFPVDILNNCSFNVLENSADDYLADLRCADPDNPEYFSLANHSEVQISLSTVGFVPLFGGDQSHKVLALFAPEDTLTAVAFYLADQWWAVEDIVRTSNPSREGLHQVRTLGERVVLYVLNRIIYRKREMERDEVPFLCHGSSDYAKIFWREGEAVGFYSVKPPGSMCPAYLTQSYQLPVLDTMFIRKRYQDKEFALQILEDFVDSFTEENLGLRYPLSALMFTACKQYVEKYPGDREILWEVEGVGHWFQRTLISSLFQKKTQRLSETSKSDLDTLQPEPEPEIKDPVCESQSEPSEPCLAMDIQEEPEEEKLIEDNSEEQNPTPVSTHIGSSQLKRPKISRKELETEEDEDDKSNQNEATKLESKEQIVENFTELIQQLAEDKDDSDMAKLQEEILCKPVGHILEDNQDILRHPEESGGNNQSTEPAVPEPFNGDLTKENNDTEKYDTDAAVQEDIINEALEPQELDTQEIEREVLDTESNLEPGDTDEKSLTTLVSVNMDLEKSLDSYPDQVISSDDLETSSQENMAIELENTVIRQEEDIKEDLEGKDTEACSPVSGKELSGNGLPSYEETDGAEECSTSDTTETMDTGTLEKHSINAITDTLPTLRQGPLLVVELQDVAFQQLSEGQKSQSGDLSEESAVETDQSVQKSMERGGESSSEEAEAEVPVIERRGLRRKARAYKGPAKKRNKVV